MMKKWLAIIVLLLSAAMALAEQGSNPPYQSIEKPATAHISQSNAEGTSALNAPMLATAATAPIQLNGTGDAQAKGSRHNEHNETSTSRLSNIYNQEIAPRTILANHSQTVTCLHSAKRYIYFICQMTI